MSVDDIVRPLREEEIKLLLWMFEHGTEDLKSFRSQIEELLAAPWCDCGCPSIRLQVSDQAPLGADVRNRLIGDFEGRTEKGELVGVLLFQRDRRLDLLEIYSIDGLAKGEFGLPMLNTLRMLEWEPSPHNPNLRIPKSPESPE